MNNADLIAEFKRLRMYAFELDGGVCVTIHQVLLLINCVDYMANKQWMEIVGERAGGKLATIDARWQVSELIKSIYERQNR